MLWSPSCEEGDLEGVEKRSSKMKTSKLIISFLFIIINILLHSSTIEVKQDGSSDFTNIQDAINSSTNSDTVLVYPGTYYENINMNNHDVTLCSLEATTGHSAYITTTIIDGNQSGSCIKIMNGETVTIQGFSLTHGTGTYFNLSTNGGGIFAKDFATVVLKSCKIFDNHAPGGSGVYFRYADAFISNVEITENRADYVGGGLYVYGYPIEFDTNNRCSVYNNHSTSYQDVFIQNVDEISEIYLDKVSFPDPDAYYIGGYRSSFTLDYLTYEFEYISSDIYVSPEGSDDNSGLTLDSPMKTINNATYHIESDSINTHTILLLAGVYTPQNQQFSINLKSNIILKGENKETTIIDGQEQEGTSISIASFSKNVEIRDLSIENATQCSIESPDYCENITIENINILNGTGTTGSGGLKLYTGGDIRIINTLIDNCYSPHSSAINIGNSRTVYIDNLISRNNRNATGDNFSPCNKILFTDSVKVVNSKFINNINNNYEPDYNWTSTSALGIYNDSDQGFGQKWVVENCLFYDNISYNEEHFVGGATITISPMCEEGYFVNNTIIDNRGSNSLWLGGLDTHVYNNIFYNNAGKEVAVPNTFQAQFGSNVTFSNNLIKNGYSGFYNQNTSLNEITWLNDPLNVDPLLDSLNVDWPFFPLDDSPVIDAGTTNFPEGYEMPLYDLAGNPRVHGTNIDLGCFEWVEGMASIEDEVLICNSGYRLSNYPNPFNPNTTISYSLNSETQVKLEIYNVKGQKVKTLVNEKQERGEHSQSWDGIDNSGNPVSSGVYLYKLKTDYDETVKRMMLIK